jgi:hypothetical protein
MRHTTPIFQPITFEAVPDEESAVMLMHVLLLRDKR